MVSKCERCNKDAHFLEQCSSCNLLVCRSCHKSSKTADKTHRLIICKTCWTSIPKRRKWEQA